MSVYVQDRSIAWGGMTRGTLWLLILTSIAWPVQVVLDVLTGMPDQYSTYLRLFALWADGPAPWQFVSYMFLHGGFLHLLSNMLCLLLIGPETERAMQTKHFVIMYFFSGILGALGWVLTNAGGQSWGPPCIGASGAVFGVFAAFVAMFPNRKVYVILFPMYPIKSWKLALGLLVIHFIFYFLGHLDLKYQTAFTVAWEVHIAGGLAGFIYTLTIFRPEKAPWGKANLEKANRNALLRKLTFRKSLIESEYEKILDKIADHGQSSLSPEEREMLARYSEDEDVKGA